MRANGGSDIRGVSCLTVGASADPGAAAFKGRGADAPSDGTVRSFSATTAMAGKRQRSGGLRSPFHVTAIWSQRSLGNAHTATAASGCVTL